MFVAWNGAIVVGHHENHEAMFHLPQLCYLSLFSFSLTLLESGPSLLRWMRDRPLLVISLSLSLSLRLPSRSGLSLLRASFRSC
jgi:hypothetical protein